MMFQSFGRCCVVMIATLPITGGMMCSAVEGQVRTASRQQDRGQFMDGLIRDLVDSQMNFHSAPLEPVPAANATVETQRARQGLQQFSQHADRLVTALRYEERYSPALRTVLADALRIKAYADALVRNVQASGDTRQILADYAELDRGWRLVAHQLQQTPNMGRSVLQWVTALNQVNDQLGQLLKIDPQLQRNELIYHIVTLRADLQHLDEDIAIDLYSHPDRAQLQQQLRILRSSAQQLQLTLENRYPYDYVKTGYQNFLRQWKPVKLKLRGLDNRYIQRHVSRITSVNERLHELLWLPPVIDGNEILYLAESLKANVDRVSDQISLKKLMSVPNATQIFARATDFYSLCDDFRQTVARETQFDNVRWDFRELDVAWNDLRSTLLPLNDPEAIQHVAVIDQSIMQLRNSLGLRTQINRDEAIQVVSTLNNMTDLLNYDLTQSVGQSNRYPSQFRSEAVNSSRALRETVRALYDGVARNGSEESIRGSIQKLASDWSRLMQVVNKIPAEDRASIARTVHQISPAVAKLQVMYAY